MPTFRPYDQFVGLGEAARFYCEAFVGKVKLPDARSFISWYQVFDGEQEQSVDGVQTILTRWVQSGFRSVASLEEFWVKCSFCFCSLQRGWPNRWGPAHHSPHETAQLRPIHLSHRNRQCCSSSRDVCLALWDSDSCQWWSNHDTSIIGFDGRSNHHLHHVFDQISYNMDVDSAQAW